jgi:hypothetical protein
MEKKEGWKVALHNKFYKEDKLLPMCKTYHNSYDFDWYNEETNPWTIMIKTDSYKKSQDWYSIAHWTVFSILRMDTNFKNEREVNISAHKMSIKIMEESIEKIKDFESVSIAKMEKAEEEIKDLKSELYDTKRDNKYLEEDNKRLEKENKRLYKEMRRFRKELNLRKAGLK